MSEQLYLDTLRANNVKIHDYLYKEYYGSDEQGCAHILFAYITYLGHTGYLFYNREFDNERQLNNTNLFRDMVYNKLLCNICDKDIFRDYYTCETCENNLSELCELCNVLHKVHRYMQPISFGNKLFIASKTNDCKCKDILETYDVCNECFGCTRTNYPSNNHDHPLTKNLGTSKIIPPKDIGILDYYYAWKFPYLDLVNKIKNI